MTNTAEKRARFRALHDSGCFVLPNPWDLGSARLLQHLSFAALASTSSGHAWTLGKADYAPSRDETLAHLVKLCASVDLPVNADFESGFAAAPQDVAINVALAIDAGVSGLSIEDTKVGEPGLYDLPFAVERIRAVRAVTQGAGVVLVARTEILLHDGAKVSQAIDSLVAFADAGADCLYAPGVTRREDIAAMVKAVAPKPVNVLMWGPGLTVQELADLGVRRISIGGALARVAWGAMLNAAEQIKAGSFDGLVSAVPGKRLNDIFAGFSRQ